MKAKTKTTETTENVHDYQGPNRADEDCCSCGLSYEACDALMETD